MRQAAQKIALTADWIFPIHSPPIPKGIVLCGEDGTIEEVLNPRNSPALPNEVVRFEGVICPGFVNTHCHLELSHLHRLIPRKEGFVSFAKNVISKRQLFAEEEIQEAIAKADDLMDRNGIVAVGDISNTASSFLQKEKSRIAYFTFIELLGLNESLALEVYEKGKILQKQSKQPSSLVPHAPYTASQQLMKMLAEGAGGLPISIHNQESLAESEFSQTGKGPVRDLYQFLNISLDTYQPSGKKSLQTFLPHLFRASKILLVHNTFTTEEDFAWANKLHSSLYWCTCPCSNLYIEDRLPNYEIFLKKPARITIGTDSLASNDSLSILDEIKVIAEASSRIPLNTLLTWATKNGADFLGMPELGTLEKNKRPGIIQISPIREGPEGLPILTKESSVSVIHQSRI